jgi:hypothetical protein
MSRFTMTLAAAATSAVAAIAAVALPAVGADSTTPRKQAKPDGDFTAFVSCLRSHGLADAPADPVALKPWLAAREGSDPDSVKAAMAACDDKLPAQRHEVVRAGPDIEKIIACVRSHGLDAPTAPDAFKRWMADKEASDPDALDNVLRDCKMELAPEKQVEKPGSCGDDAPKPADGVAKPADKTPKRGADEAAEPGI